MYTSKTFKSEYFLVEYRPAPIKRLNEVAKRLNLSNAALRQLINRNGGFLEKKSNPMLYGYHLDIIVKVYIESMHELLKKAKQQLKTEGIMGFSKGYFAQFVNEDQREDCYFFDWQLDDELMRDALMAKFDSVTVRTDAGIYAFRKLFNTSVKICAGYYLDFKTLIKSILATHLFFSYGSEEEANKAVSQSRGFFVASV